MSSVDERIVEMKFNNAQFESGVKQTQSSLDGLKKGLNLDESARSLQNLNDTGNHFNLTGLSDGVQNIGGRFTALGVAGVAALATIATQAVQTGERLIKSLTIDPIKSGLEEYNTNLNSVQTILANTQASGATLKDVNGALNELNLYSDKTIYNFSEMARNIGTFTAAGVDLKTATAGIKGIANLAALSGSNSQQASTAMYQLSQAISSGKVGLQDWNSVVNAGMGGTVFQRALAQTAVQMGTIQDSAVKLSGKMKNVKIDGQSFRDSISAKDGKPSWLTSDVLTKTLSHFTGDMTDAQLASEGFSKSAIKQIQEQAKVAQDAATVVKTLPQLIGTLQESAQSGFSQSFQYIFGDFEQAKELFTAVNRTVGAMISNSANARNAILKEWEAKGGRATAITAIAQAFQGVMNVIKPMQKAFAQIFPPITAQTILDITSKVSVLAQTFNNFTRQNGPLFQRTFAGIFAVLDIGRMIIVEVAKTLFSLFGTASGGAVSFLTVTAAIGDFLVKVHDAIENGQGLTKFFDGLRSVLQVPLALIGALGGAIAGLFSAAEKTGGPERFNNAIGTMQKALTPFNIAIGLIQKAWTHFAGSVADAFQVFAPLASQFGDLFSNLGTAIADSIKTGDFNHVLDLVNTGLLGGIVLLVKKFMSGPAIKFDFTLFGGMQEALKGLTGTFEAMQQNLKANVLLKIAGAIGIITLSVFILSTIDSGALTKALIAITTMFTQLGAALLIFEKIASGPGIIKLPIVAGSLILIALAIGILAAAVKSLSGLSWEELAKGLSGVTVLLAALAGYSQIMSKTATNMVATGVGLTVLAIAINLLALAVQRLGGMDLVSLSQGLGAVVVILAAIAGYSRIMKPEETIKTALAVGILGVALNLFALAIQRLASLDLLSLAQGLGAMVVILAAVAGAMRIMPKNMIVQAAALAVVGVALNLFALAINQLGTSSYETLAKGLGTLAVALAILAGAMYIMTGTVLGAAAMAIAAGSIVILASALLILGQLDIVQAAIALGVLIVTLGALAGAMALMTAGLPGAVALVVAAGAILVLATALQVIGSMSPEQLIVSLIGMAAAIGILALAAGLLTPVLPQMLALGIALLFIGAGLALAGIGILALSVGLTGIAIAGSAAATGIVAIVSAVLGLIPLIISTLGEVIVGLAQVIITGAPAIVAALVAILSSLISAIIKVVPQFIRAMTVVIVALLNAIVILIPKFVDSGLKIVGGILEGIANNIGKIVIQAIRIVTNFIDAIANRLPSIIQSGVNLVISFVEGLAKAIDNNSERMGRAGGKLAAAIITGMVKGISAGLGEVVKAATGIGGAALDAIKGILGIASPSKEFRKIGEFATEGFKEGLVGTGDQITAAAKDMKGKLKDAIRSSNEDIDQAEAKLKKLTSARKQDTDAIAKARAELAQATKERGVEKGLYTLLTKGFSDEVDVLKSRAKDLKGVKADIEATQKDLDDAIKTRDDYQKSIQGQYSGLDSIGGDTQLTAYLQGMKQEATNTENFAAALATLRSQGLNDQLYTKLLSEGAVAMPFVQQLINAGPSAVTEINALGDRINQTAGALAVTASTSMYQAGVDIQKGLLAGLKSQRDGIQAEMDDIAASMVKAFKKRLKSKSPSKVFIAEGVNITDGIVKGLKDTAGNVDAASADIGGVALSGFQKTLSNMDAMTIGIDANPTIRPVLDLSAVQSGANQIGGMFGDQALSLDGTVAKAATISSGYDANQQAIIDTKSDVATSGGVVYNQYNNSPKALSPAEIYRNTKNQLSVAKGGLDT